MARKKTTKKPKTPPARTWSAAEDHYLRTQVDKKDLAELAADVGAGEPETAARLAELGFDAARVAELTAERKRQRGLRGFQVGSDGDPKNRGIVAMTGGRSHRDDKAAQRDAEAAGREAYMDRYKNNIHRGG
jgi:hypothetical protein